MIVLTVLLELAYFEKRVNGHSMSVLSVDALGLNHTTHLQLKLITRCQAATSSPKGVSDR